MSDRTCTVEGCVKASTPTNLMCGMHYQRLRTYKPCTVEGCTRGLVARGMCPAHYQLARRQGFDPIERVRVCTVEGCPEPHWAKTLCKVHYLRQNRKGSTDLRVNPGCEVAGCERKHSAHGLCSLHVRRLRRTGFLDLPEPIQKHCMVDGCGVAFPLGYSGSLGMCGTHYARVYRARGREDQGPRDTSSKYYEKNLARRERLKAATVETFPAREIFERDGWFCYLCCTPVDPALKWPHRMSATLDHVIPLVLDGEHSRRNVATAHFLCNIRKGTRLIT